MVLKKKVEELEQQLAQRVDELENRVSWCYCEGIPQRTVCTL